MIVGEAMEFNFTNIILLALVIILSGLLVIRQRQLKALSPIGNLSKVLERLVSSMRTNRLSGNIQKVANEISQILKRDLGCDRILFFRRQKNHLELNYIYGLKDLARSKFRITLSKKIIERLTIGEIILVPTDYSNLFGAPLMRLVEQERINLVFPIFWKDNLFGVYLIRTSLSLDHPLIRLFLMFLNQDLSVAYHVKRIESSREILQSQVSKAISNNSGGSSGFSEDDPGNLAELFSCYNVNELKADVADRLKAGLRARRIVFIPGPSGDKDKELRFSRGLGDQTFSLNGDQFKKLFGSLKKDQTYETGEIKEIESELVLKKSLARSNLSQVTRFSLENEKPGLLFWSPRQKNAHPERNLINRLEKIARQAIVNAREFERMEELTYTDSLTSLYNYRYFVKRLAEEIQRANRYNRQVGLLLFDIDDFKLYNDTYGHQWGDRLLCRMGEMLGQTLRSIDIVSRYGGDEFCIIMPEADKATCGVFMDRLRKVIMSTNFHNNLKDYEGRVTISIGGAVYPTDADSAEKLIYCSDMALLKAKASGRNRSIVFENELLRDTRP